MRERRCASARTMPVVESSKMLQAVQPVIKLLISGTFSRIVSVTISGASVPDF